MRRGRIRDRIRGLVRGGCAVGVMLAAAMGPAALAAQDAAGHWEGAIQLPGTPLDVDVDLARDGGAWSGDISIPAQGAVDLPLTGIRVDGDAVVFTIEGVPGDPTFDGRLSAAGDTIAGEFTQGGLQVPFTLVREATGGQRAARSLEGLDAWMAEALEDFGVPGAAVGVVVDGEVVVSEGFGYRDVAGELPVDERTLFPIGSSTKAFTTFGLARLADEGRFDWDRQLTEYLPEVRFADPLATQLITPRDMVTHRTGLPRHDLLWYGWDAFSPAVLIDALPHLPLTQEPRAVWQYNNLMFVLAGHLLGELRGESWEASIRELVLNPLGMDETDFDVEDMRLVGNHALPYDERDDTISVIPFRDIRPVGPAGSINSNIDDMVQWLRVHLDRGRIGGDTLISAGSLRELHTPQMNIAAFPNDPEIGPLSYAMGWFVEPYRGHFRLHHGGNIDGFSALVTLFPFDRVGVVVLTNRNGSGLPELLTRHVADRVLDLEPREWATDALQGYTEGAELQREAAGRLAGERVAGTEPAHAIDRYAGTYEHPGYGPLTIRLDGDRLVAEYHGITAPLEHWHFEVFSGLRNPHDPTFHRLRFQFENDVNGRVASVRVPMEPLLEPAVFERLPDPRLTDPEYLATLAGSYALGSQAIEISVQGGTLVLSVPGQPDYHLEPDLEDTFRLPDVNGYWLEFEKDEAGEVAAVVLHQPNGVFRAERMD